MSTLSPLGCARSALAIAISLCAALSASAQSSATQPVGGGGRTGNKPPVLTSLNSKQVPGKKFEIFGRVQDETPGMCGVVISGAASGVILCNSSGYFSAIFDVAVPGAISVIVGDGVNQTAPIQHQLTNVAPTVGGFTAIQGSGNAWTFSGSVGDEAPSGLTVTLTGPAGVNGLTATVNPNGSWSLTVVLPANTGGNVTATATDWYGLTGAGYTTF